MNWCSLVIFVTHGPFHPASHGEAERAVALVKAGLSKVATDIIMASLAQQQGRDSQHRLDRVFRSCTGAHQSTTDIAPADMQLKFYSHPS